MPKTLVLITSAYPFGHGEQFLESEVDVLAEEFDRVVVVPQKTTAEVREVPPNFVVDDGFARLVAGDGALKRVAIALFFFWKRREFPTRFRELRPYLVAAYYAHRSEQYFKRYCDVSQVSREGTIFYSYWFYPVVTGLVNMKLNCKTDGRFSVVTRAHGSDVYESVHGISEFPFRRGVINNLTRVFCISENGASHICSKYGAKNVSISRLGSRVPRSVPEPGEGPITIVSCSSINSIKRVSRIFHALNFLARELSGESIRWVHIGTGPLQESLKAELEKARQPNLDVTLKGSMTNDDVHRFYEQTYVDCFINLSTSEGVPVSIMEAMSYGIPALATRVGGVPEIVEAGAGALVEVDAELPEISLALLKIVKAGREGSFRAEARRVWALKYDAERNYRDFATGLALL